MNNSDTRAILAQIPYDFYGGEICTIVGTLNNILVRQHVQSTCGSILNGHVDQYSMGMWGIDTQGSMI
jgi:hypothetical protein